VPVTGQRAGSIVVIAFGSLVTGVGIVTGIACLSVPGSDGRAGDCAGSAVIAAVGVLFLVVGIVAFVARPGPSRGPAAGAASPPRGIRPVVVERTVVEETVKVRCRYCNALNPETATKCATCGAPL